MVVEQLQNLINCDVCVCFKDIVDLSRLYVVDEGFVIIDVFIFFKLIYGNVFFNVYLGDFFDFFEEFLVMFFCFDVDCFKILI